MSSSKSFNPSETLISVSYTNSHAFTSVNFFNMIKQKSHARSPINDSPSAVGGVIDFKFQFILSVYYKFP